MNIYQLDKWFENYDKWVHQAERAERLGIAWTQKDKLLGVTYYSIQELDLKAEELRLLYKETKEKELQAYLEYRKARLEQMEREQMEGEQSNTETNVEDSACEESEEEVQNDSI